MELCLGVCKVQDDFCKSDVLLGNNVCAWMFE